MKNSYRDNPWLDLPDGYQDTIRRGVTAVRSLSGRMTTGHFAKDMPTGRLTGQADGQDMPTDRITGQSAGQGTSTGRRSGQLAALKKEITNADAIVIGAGAGLSTSADLLTAGRGSGNTFLISKKNTVFTICIQAASM